MSNPLIGRTLLDVLVAKDREAILFETDAGEIVAKCDADCCSHTWVEHIELPVSFPAKVLSVESLDWGERDEKTPCDDLIQHYGLKITTERGDLVIDYRNESNGYYGGSLSWPNEYQYGGVYGQNNSECEWVPVEKP